MTRRSLLASLMALSLFCGGLGVASAVDVVHVDESASGGIAGVYTTTKVDTLLKDYGTKTDVETNKNAIAALQTTTTNQGKEITANTTQIANNKDAIDKKIDTVTADATYATKEALRNLEDTVDGKADEAAVSKALDGKADKTAVTTLEGRVEGVEGKVTTLEGKVGDASTSISANEGKITDLQKKTTNLSDDGTALNGMTTVETDALKVTGGNQQWRGRDHHTD